MEQEIQSSNNNTSRELVSMDQIEHFKAIWYMLKGKRDTDIKLFNGHKKFRHQDIVELNDKVYRKLRLHQLVTDTTTVVVSLSNKEIKNFGNWNEFLQFDWKIAPTTNYITIEWDFNFILPNQHHGVPQTHTLRVRIGNGLRPNEMIQVIFQGGDESDLEEAQAQAVCKIDFVNAQICSELKTIVSEWYDALPNNSDEDSLIKRIVKSSVIIKQAIIFLCLLSGGILLTFMAQRFIVPDTNMGFDKILIKLYEFTLFSLLFMYVFYVLGALFANNVIENHIENFKRKPMFEFTKGDENKLQEVNKNNTRVFKKLFRDLVVTIGINILAYTIGKYFPLIAEMIK